MAAGRAADAAGPRRAQLLNLAPFAAGALLSALAPSLGVFVAGRALVGAGAGAASLLAPRYVAEIALPALRGRLGALHQVAINAGILLAYAAGVPYERGFAGFNIGSGGGSGGGGGGSGSGGDGGGGALFVAYWRVMLLGQLPLAALQLAALLRSPESPVWLEATAGLRDAADDAFLRLWGPYALGAEAAGDDDGDGDDDENGGGDQAQHFGLGVGGHPHPLLLGPADVQQQQQQQQQHQRQPRRDAFGGLLRREHRRMVALALALPLLQQASGINTVVYDSTAVFLKAGARSPVLASVVVGAVNLGCTLAAAAWLDARGRRPLLLASFGGMAAALAGVAAAAWLLAASPAAQGALTVALVLAYVACFAAGAGPVPWVVLSEILPPRLKGAAASLATAAGWLANLAVVLSFDSLMARLGVGGAYALYAALNAAACVLVYAFLPETAGKSLREIEQMLLVPPAAAATASGSVRGGSGGGGGAGGGGDNTGAITEPLLRAEATRGRSPV